MVSVSLPRKKRIRYKIPTYKKSDKINFNIKCYKCNEKHIFRYGMLQRIYEAVARNVFRGQLSLPFEDLRLYKDGLVIHLDTVYGIYDLPCQAEIDGTQGMPVSQRVKIHIRLLRFLKKGYGIKKAVRLCRQAVIG